MQSATITDTQHLPVIAAPKDSAGKPGKIAAGSVATWSTSDPTVAIAASNLLADPTGLTGVVSAVAPGTCNATCNATNPSGTFADTFSCTITGGDAVGFNFTFGTPF